jgi:hypothetical protein
VTLGEGVRCDMIELFRELITDIEFCKGLSSKVYWSMNRLIIESEAKTK